MKKTRNVGPHPPGPTLRGGDAFTQTMLIVPPLRVLLMKQFWDESVMMLDIRADKGKAGSTRWRSCCCRRSLSFDVVTNQLQLERDSHPSSCEGVVHPRQGHGVEILDVCSPVPDHHQGIEEWWHHCAREPRWICVRWTKRPWDTDVSYDRCAGAKRRCLERARSWLSRMQPGRRHFDKSSTHHGSQPIHRVVQEEKTG